MVSTSRRSKGKRAVPGKPRVFGWTEFMEDIYDRKEPEYEWDEFLRSIEPGTAHELTIPDNRSKQSVRTSLYKTAKRLQIPIMVSGRVSESTLIVGRPPEEDEEEDE